MHATTKLGMTALATLVGLFGTAGMTSAQSFRHIDQLALQLQRQVQGLHDEVDHHFRQTPMYRHLHHDVEEMERLAKHIHHVAHRCGSVSHLRHDVNRLDYLYHHVERLVVQLALTRQISPRTISHFRHELRQVGRTLHHMQDDLRHMHDHDHGHGHGPIHGHGRPPVRIVFPFRW